jgi:hypothetical protein
MRCCPIRRMEGYYLPQLTCTFSMAYGLAMSIDNMHQLKPNILPLYLCNLYLIAARYNRKQLSVFKHCTRMHLT